MSVEDTVIHPDIAVDRRESAEAGPIATATTPAADSPTSALMSSPLFWLLVLAVLDIAMPFVPVHSRATAVVGAVALTVAYVIAVVQFAAQTTRLQLSPALSVALFAASLGLWLGLQWVMDLHLSRPLNFYLYSLKNLSLLCTAVFGGSVVARVIKFPNMLGPVCAIIAMIDIWGVLFGGIVSQMLTNPATREISKRAMSAHPVLGAAMHSRYGIPLPAVGIGDYLFLGVLFAALHAHRMNWQGAIRWVVPLVALALLSISLSDVRVLPWDVPALPGLLFIGLGIAIPNLQYFEYTREEKFALLYAGVFVVILTGLLYVGFTKALPAKEHQQHRTAAKLRAQRI